MINLKKVISLVLVAIFVFSLTGCLRYTSNMLEITTRPSQGDIPEQRTTTIYVTDNIPGNTQETTTGSISVIPEQTTLPVENTTAPIGTQNPPPVQQETTTQSAQKDPSTWTTAEILKFTSDAVAKTKAYTKTVTVDHKEAFTANVTKAPGGTVVKNIANGIIEGVIQPTDEVLTFNGGQTQNTEGETVPLLLPKRGAFTLTADGIASATAKKNGNSTQISIKLVQELGTLTDHPKHQAASVGYLDASDVDLGPVKVNYLNITYYGTTIDLVVNADGYVTDAVYKIPIKVDCEGSVMGATAQIECEGEQSETWKINW